MTDVDGFEKSARIVEAFSAGQSEEVAALLAQVAMAIREKAIAD
jgi:predicted lipid-binding transport protein (Tim44 family)